MDSGCPARTAVVGAVTARSVVAGCTWTWIEVADTSTPAPWPRGDSAVTWSV